MAGTQILVHSLDPEQGFQGSYAALRLNEVKKANYHTYKRFNQGRDYEKGLYSWFYQEIVLFTDFATNPAQRFVN